ncbi:DUF2130 domain-containing protein [Gaetbulibacter aestuarii]|uniref:DUF2130 domain-containing protein n=1 Tax=Gaetbulibacter aestuarii TaxID=1502358 RepID=A0ABW7N4L0_9FLAO
MENQTQINCPECGNKINVNDILKHQIEESIKKEYQSKFFAQSQDLKKQQIEFEKKKEDYESELRSAKKELENSLKSKIKLELAEEQSELIQSMQEELKQKSDQVKELHKKEGEILKLKREMDEAISLVKLEAQKEINKLLKTERDNAKKEALNESELKIKEYEKQLADQKKLIEEMKRKHEQGSMQLQGEVQELAIEEWLQSKYPLDVISEIKKGANGADCLEIVNTRVHQNCGSIYYESKRTKNFSNSWIEKFKNDIREKNANIGVLVTEVLPNDMERMGLKDGIWICTYEEFKGLSAVLRESIINIHLNSVSQENKGDKMVMLYDFLTSNEFRLQVEGIVEGFTQMQIDLASEKNAMKRLWKKREKQIDKVITNTLNMHGAVKGIAGTAIQEIKLLDLDEKVIGINPFN